jgi:protoporphyrinogen oxidase
MAMDSVPQESMRIASGLPYRDYMTVGVLVSGLALKNKTKMPTLGGIVPDNWVYVHDSRVKMGRFQIYNNWSPYLVANPEGTVWLGLEYFCNEGDALWTKTDDEFAADAIKEMVELGLINNIHEVLDFHVERVKKAYPAYFDTYSEINVLRTWLDTIPNLYCIGRNGQHRYNNIDHSMCTAFRAVEVLLDGSSDKTKLWNVNTEHEYHESK